MTTMTLMIVCPRCRQELTHADVRMLWGRYANSRRKRVGSRFGKFKRAKPIEPNLSCPYCGKMLRIQDVKRLWGQYRSQRRWNAVDTSPRCPHCRRPLSSEDVRKILSAHPEYMQSERVPELKPPSLESVPESEMNRDKLLAWLQQWRYRQGLGDSARVLSNRSFSQLKKMYEQAQAGRNYRLGRGWREQTESG